MKPVLLISSLLIFSTTTVMAVTGRILDDIEAEQADTTALTAEAQLFKSIGMGIAISLARCDGQDGCNPTVDQTEIKQLLDTLNVRIDDLILRQQNSEQDLTDILTVYVDQRESYLRYQQKLQDITGIEDIGTTAEDEDTFAEEEVNLEEQVQKEGQVDLSIFEDADESLLEDSGLQEDALPVDESLEDDFNPEDL